MNILETKDLYFTYPDGDARKVILNDVNVSFEKGKFYTILGASGSGKTTFLSLIAALDKAERGEILYEGKSLSEIGYEKYRRNNVGIVFQSYNLIPYMNAVENVMVAMSITDNEMEKDMRGTGALLRSLEPGQDVAIFIGPEGGFSPEEVQAAMEAGVRPITLGKRILRTETAGLAILSVLMFQLEEKMCQEEDEDGSIFR